MVCTVALLAAASVTGNGYVAVTELVFLVPVMVVSPPDAGSFFVPLVGVSGFLSEEHVAIGIVTGLFGIVLSCFQAHCLAVVGFVP